MRDRCRSGRRAGDHPHIGGEHLPPTGPFKHLPGSSPRWRVARERRSHPQPSRDPRVARNTFDHVDRGGVVWLIPGWAGSTYVGRRRRSGGADHPREGRGSTRQRGHQSRTTPVHPRAGGERTTNDRLAFAETGSAPHRRGECWMLLESRTSATAHPRVGGEHSDRACRVPLGRGSSPRRRGTRCTATDHPAYVGLSPALAGRLFWR